MSEINDLNCSRLREVAYLGSSGSEFDRRMVLGKKEPRWAFTLDRGTEKLSSRKSMIELWMMCSRSLQTMLVKEVGR